MASRNPSRDRALADVASAQRGLVTAAQLRELGVDPSGVQHRIHRSRVWQRLLPGIYLTHSGRPLLEQRRLAALLYAGEGAMLSGASALDALGSRVAARYRAGPALVLIPHHRHRSSAGFVEIERTVRPPTSTLRSGLALAPAPRAAIDGARRVTDLDAVRALLSDVVQSGLATVADLADELAQAPRRGTRAPRLALEALAAGTRSAPEAALREAWLASRLPEPLWNPTLTTLEGAFIARPDAYVVSAGVAVEVDSREFHYSPEDWEHTMARHGQMSTHGIVVLHVPPSRISRDAQGLLREVATTVAAQAGRPALKVRVVST